MAAKAGGRRTHPAPSPRKLPSGPVPRSAIAPRAPYLFLTLRGRGSPPTAASPPPAQEPLILTHSARGSVRGRARWAAEGRGGASQCQPPPRPRLPGTPSAPAAAPRCEGRLASPEPTGLDSRLRTFQYLRRLCRLDSHRSGRRHTLRSRVSAETRGAGKCKSARIPLLGARIPRQKPRGAMKRTRERRGPHESRTRPSPI